MGERISAKIPNKLYKSLQQFEADEGISENKAIMRGLERGLMEYGYFNGHHNHSLSEYSLFLAKISTLAAAFLIGVTIDVGYELIPWIAGFAAAAIALLFISVYDKEVNKLVGHVLPRGVGD